MFVSLNSRLRVIKKKKKKKQDLGIGEHADELGDDVARPDQRD